MERAGGSVAGAEEEVVQEDAFGVGDVLEVDGQHVPARLDRQRVIADNVLTHLLPRKLSKYVLMSCRNNVVKCRGVRLTNGSFMHKGRSITNSPFGSSV